MSKLPRLISVDVLRTLAILFMIQGHFLYYWTPWNKLWQEGVIVHHSLLRWWVDVDNFSAPVFAFLAGFSVWLWIQKNKVLLPISDYTLKLVKRGVLIFILGFGITYLGRSDLVLSNILNLIGFGIVLVALLHRFPLWVFWLLIFALLISAPFLQAWSGFAVYDFNQIHWSLNFYELSGTQLWKEVFINYFFRSYQPIVPWLIFPLFGFVCAKTWLGSQHYRSLRRNALVLFSVVALVISILLQLGVFTENPYLHAFNYYPMTTPMVLASLAATILSLMSFYYVLDYLHFELPTAFKNFFLVYSRFSLTVYLLHNVLLLGVIRWGTNWAAYANLMSVGQGIFAAWFFIGSFYAVLYFWFRWNNGKYSFEWWLRKLS